MFPILPEQTPGHVQDYLSRAFEKGYLHLETGGRTERIAYVEVGRSERWSNPKEKVRAAYYAELILRYGYGACRSGATARSTVRRSTRTPSSASSS